MSIRIYVSIVFLACVLVMASCGLQKAPGTATRFHSAGLIHRQQLADHAPKASTPVRQASAFVSRPANAFSCRKTNQTTNCLRIFSTRRGNKSHVNKRTGPATEVLVKAMTSSVLKNNDRDEKGAAPVSEPSPVETTYLVLWLVFAGATLLCIVLAVLFTFPLNLLAILICYIAGSLTSIAATVFFILWLIELLSRM